MNATRWASRSPATSLILAALSLWAAPSARAEDIVVVALGLIPGTPVEADTPYPLLNGGVYRTPSGAAYQQMMTSSSRIQLVDAGGNLIANTEGRVLWSCYVRVIDPRSGSKHFVIPNMSKMGPGEVVRVIWPAADFTRVYLTGAVNPDGTVAGTLVMP